MILMSPGEVVDRWSILQLKQKYDPSFSEEFIKYDDEVLQLIVENPIILENVRTIADINAEIWKLEADIRSGAIPDTELVEIGKRALAIRDLNKERVIAKGQIDIVFGCTPDKKVNHRSE